MPNLRRRRKTMKAYIRIDTFEDIMRLNDVARRCDYDMYIESGAVRVNPKSVRNKESGITYHKR